MIRQAQEKDIKALTDLLGQVLLVHYNSRPDIFKSHGAKYTEQQLRELINDPLKPIFVYVDENDKVLGHLFTQIIHHKETSNSNSYTTLFLDDGSIDENFRHKGIGSALVQYAEKYAISIGAHNITGNVWDFNCISRAMLEKVGMKPQKTVMEKILTK